MNSGSNEDENRVEQDWFSSEAKRLGQSEWEELRERVIENYNQQCINCDSSKRLEVHHIVPISAGGKMHYRTSYLYANLAI